ncbi:MAG: DUF445 domain-containing protein [Nocardioidaceae bacterium]|nr:DUF445 domain-containing protein [Nocardioidaceae bacterium]
MSTRTPLQLNVPGSGDADAARLKGLRRMQAVALSLLVLAAVVFVATLGRDGVWGFVNAAAEASMVGAIADWFAVTALFRHPLGLPIPHTALIPTRKAALGQSLQEFVTDNFLSQEVVRERVMSAQVSRRIGVWVSDEAHGARVVAEVAKIARQAVVRIKDDDVRALIEQTLIPRLADEELSPVAGQLLQEVVAEGAHHGLVDLAVGELHRYLTDHEGDIVAVVQERAPWWTPQWVDERVSERLIREAIAFAADVRDDPEHRARKALDDFLAQLADDLQHDADTRERAERLKRRVLAQPKVGDSAVSIWNALRNALADALADEDSVLRRRGVEALVGYGRTVVEDPEAQHRLDTMLSDAAAFLVENYGSELATVISETVDRWDGHEAARRIELHVGRDLQFIRINGTVVGGLVGLVIHTFVVLV